MDATDVRVKQLIGQALQLHQQGQLDQAEPLYVEALRLAPENPDAMYLLGTLYAQQGRSEMGRELLAGVISVRPTHAEAHNSLGLLYGGLKDLASAEYHLREAISQKPDYVDALLNLGAIVMKAGRPADAIEPLQRAIAFAPRSHKAFSTLGSVHAAQGDYEQAVANYEHALDIQPGSWETNYRLALVLLKMGRKEQAIPSFERVVAVNAKMQDAHRRLGALLLERKDYVHAAVYLQQATTLDPGQFGAFFDLGNTYLGLQQPDKALNAFKTAAVLRPDLADADYAVALALKQCGKLVDALAAANQAIAKKTEYHAAYVLSGEIHLMRATWPKAVDAFERVLAIEPENAEAMNGLAVALMNLGGVPNITRAKKLFARIVELQPDSPESLNNLGFCLRTDGKLREAIGLLSRAVALKPDYREAHLHLALALLGAGDLERGWEEYEWRWNTQNQRERPFRFPVWQGEPLERETVLIYGEQGIGDEIMFASCLPDMVEAAPKCILECDSRAAGLMARSFPTIEVQPRKNYDDDSWVSESGRRIDYQVALGSLPLFFRKSATSFPDSSTGYLVADGDRVAHWRRELERLGPGLKVGLSWRSGMAGIGRPQPRSLGHLEALFAVPRVHLINLQYDECQDEIDFVRKTWDRDIVQFQGLDLRNDLDEVAALICALDLTISHPNTVAALAGSLGRPVWRIHTSRVSEPFRLGQSQNPWFPTMALFYERADEGDVIAAELARLIRWRSRLGKPALERFERIERKRLRGEIDAALALIEDPNETTIKSFPKEILKGDVYLHSGCRERAIQGYERALEDNEYTPEAQRGIALALRGIDDQAEKVCRYLTAAASSGEVYTDAVLALLDWARSAIGTQEFNAATAALEVCAPHLPKYTVFHRCLAAVLFHSGQFEKGWRELRWRERLSEPRSFGLSAWQPNARRTLVYGEDSVVNELLFSSCLAEFVRDNPGCVVECSDALQSIFIRSFPGATVVGRKDLQDIKHVDELDCDAELALAYLPGQFRLSKEDFDRPAWVKPDPERAEYWRKEIRAEALGRRIYVGIWWDDSDIDGCFHRLEWDRVFSDCEVTFVFFKNDICAGKIEHSLRRMERASVRSISIDMNFSGATGGGGDFDVDELASLLAACDLVVAFDSHIRILAGAVGIKVWSVSSKKNIFYFDSLLPWYPVTCISEVADSTKLKAEVGSLWSNM